MTHRAWLVAALGTASYGFSIGLVHSLEFALRNLIKLPLLFVVTASVCALCYYLLSRWLVRALDLGDAARSAAAIFHDLAVLLMSLAPVTLFLALTVRKADGHSLHEYPLFLGAHVVAIAVSGSVALLHQVRRLSINYAVPPRRAALLAGSWLVVTLFVGAQASWYMRPFCGVYTVDAPFMLGTEPDFRGATSFYEAVWQLVRPPPRKS